MDKVIIFDSACRFCLSVVRFIRKHNRRAVFHFVPQQSDEGSLLIRELSVPEKDTNTVIYITGRSYLLRSSAVFSILRDMGFPWKLFYAFMLVPAFFRDSIYRFVARHRKWFF
jgi:predicted DCC family thiol-disulfide oxidoreductase YuxK